MIQIKDEEGCKRNYWTAMRYEFGVDNREVRNDEEGNERNDRMSLCVYVDHLAQNPGVTATTGT